MAQAEHDKSMKLNLLVVENREKFFLTLQNVLTIVITIFNVLGLEFLCIADISRLEAKWFSSKHSGLLYLHLV